MFPRRLALRPVTVSLLSLAVGAALTGCGPDTDLDAAAGTSSDTVVDVVDGHTVEVEQGGETVTVTLLGLDSPAADECLGAESADALEQLLPAGTEVRLESADDGLAAVYADDVLVNAELARRGLGHAVAGTAITEQVAPPRRRRSRRPPGCSEPTPSARSRRRWPRSRQAAADAADARRGARRRRRHRRGRPPRARPSPPRRRPARRSPPCSTGSASARLPGGDGRGPAQPDGDGQRAPRGRRRRSSRCARRRSSGSRRSGSPPRPRRGVQAAADEAARQAQAAADAEAARVAAEAAAAKAPAASSGGSAYYKNCDAVRAAGADPISPVSPATAASSTATATAIGCEN